jgi:superfamily II DNA or RNA helicase
MIHALRPYQEAAIDAIRARFVAGDRSTLLVLPTGTGKTVIFAEVARRTVDRGGRVLVLAHRSELLEQAHRKLTAIGVDAAIEQADRRAGDAAVVVASVQTLRGARLAAMPADSFRLVVVDEAHHATAPGYRAILDRFGGARVLGVTATPDRLDGAALCNIFNSAAYRYEMRDAIRDGWLTRIEARRVRLDVDLDAVHTRSGDLDLGELEQIYGADAAVRAVVDPLQDLAGDLRTIVFAVSVAHGDALVAAINAREPGAARALSGATPAEERRRAVDDFAAGRLRTLVNCQVLTEGFDAPGIECVAIARPTKSRGLYAQMIGRGTRLAPGKERVLVLDFVGNSKRHRLVTPAAILAGSEQVDDEVVEDAAEQEGDVLAALDRARAAAEERARRPAPERLRYWSELADIFGELPEDEPIAGEPATEGQIAALKRGRIEAPPDLSKSAASVLIEGMVARRQAGLCTYAQARFLIRHGRADAHGLGFDEASEVISRLIDGRRRRTGSR